MASAGSDKVWWDSNGFGVSGGSCFGLSCLATDTWRTLCCCLAGGRRRPVRAGRGRGGGEVPRRVCEAIRRLGQRQGAVHRSASARGPTERGVSPAGQVLERIVRFVIALDGKVNRALFERFIKTFGPFEGCARRVSVASHQRASQPCLTGGMVCYSAATPSSRRKVRRLPGIADADSERARRQATFWFPTTTGRRTSRWRRRWLREPSASSFVPRRLRCGCAAPATRGPDPCTAGRLQRQHHTLCWSAQEGSDRVRPP
jgi:hypothetical protein